MSLVAVLYALAMLVLLGSGLNLLWLTLRYAAVERQRPGQAPARTVPALDEAALPPVLVQLPLYNEPYVTERLIDACARLDYPADRLTIQVLDDSNDQTQHICTKRAAYWQAHGVNVQHVRRPERVGFKAGALKYGLTISDAPFVAVFDADFVPAPGFLKQMMPHFEAGIGVVQARWGHLNAETSWLTRVQATLMDAHFAIEQRMRNHAGCFINFNGTAGIWRRAAIQDAGGWEADTLAEDMDLSYRAQLAGWRFRFVNDIEVPAELPERMADWRQQQFRWAKGTAEVGRKLLPTIWRTDAPLHVKLEALVHLGGSVCFPAVLLAALLHAPLLVAHARGDGPGDVYLAIMGLGMLAFAGVFLAQVFAQRTLYPDWLSRLRYYPLFIAMSTGLVVSNTRAAFEGFTGRRSAFIRTPKAGKSGAISGRTEETPIRLLEGMLAIYSFVGLLLLIQAGQWVAAPFQAMFTFGFAMMSTYDAVKDGALVLELEAAPAPVPVSAPHTESVAVRV